MGNKYNKPNLKGGDKKPIKEAIANIMAGTATNVGNPNGTGPKPMSHTLSRGQQRSLELREAHADHGIKDKDTLDMPIVDREYQTTDEEDYDRGDYENSYGPGRKISPANKRMGGMVSAAQQAYSDKHTSTPPVKPVKAEKKKSYEDAWKSRDMETYGDLSKQEYFNEAARQNEMKASTGKWDAPSKPIVGKDPNRFEGRPGVEILGDEMLAEKGIKSPSSDNPDSDYFVKDGEILGEVNLENKNVIGVNTPETGMLQREKPISPAKNEETKAEKKARKLKEKQARSTRIKPHSRAGAHTNTPTRPVRRT